MTLAPHPYDVEVGDGHGYMLDRGKNAPPWRHESIPLLKQVFITADTLGEKSLNPESLWRFSDRDWSHGAGQRRADMPDSDTARFWHSRGVDVWTKWQVSLLPQMTSLTGTGGDHLFVAQGTVYKVDGSGTPGHDGLSYGWPTFTNVVASAAVFGACTDGAVVYYIDPGSGQIYSANVGSTSGSSYHTISSTTQLYYLNGRLIAVGSSGNILDLQASPAYDDLGVLPGRFIPVDMTAGLDAIYIAAVNADKGLSQVFAITIKPDGTGLNPPVAVTPPFDGTLRRVLYYEGLVFLGLEEGVRMCVPSSDGLALQIGPLIATGNCSALAGRNGMVWFGIDLYELDDSGTHYWCGLGRINPTVINADGAPAWAADVMQSGFTSTGFPIVRDAAFTADGSFLYVVTAAGQMLAPWDTPTLLSNGHIDSGLISYDIPDDKTARYLTVRTDTDSAGDMVPSIAVNGSDTFTDLATVVAGTLAARLPITVAQGGFFEIRETLQRGTDVHTGAILTRHMLEAEPIVASGSYLYVPLLLTDPVDDANDQPQKCDVTGELTYLEGLRDTGTVVTYREFGSTYTVMVQEITWLPTHPVSDRSGANATCLLKLKTV